MTAPLAELFLVLAALYLLECVLALGRDALVFSSWPRDAARITLSQALPGSVNWGLFLLPPVPPLGRTFQAAFWPISVSPDGVSNVCADGVGRESSSDDPIVHLEFDEVRSVASEGPHLLLNGRRFARCPTARTAEVWAKRVHKWKGLSCEERAKAIDAEVARFLDESRVEETLKAQSGPASDARVAGNLLFVLLFVATPLVAVWIGLSRSWVYLLAALLALWANAVYVTWRGHRQVLPQRTSERRHSTALAILTPMAAIRGHDAITRFALLDHHPLAVAFVLCDARRFREFAQDVLRDLVHPLCRDDLQPGHPAVRDADWLRGRMLDACEDWLRRIDVSPAELLAAPEPDDERSQSYCPRCRGQNVRLEGCCPRCGVALTPLFDEPQPPADGGETATDECKLEAVPAGKRGP